MIKEKLFAPKVGMQFIFKNSEYEITFVTFNKVRITTIHGGVSYEWTFDKINLLYSENKINITFNNGSLITDEKDIKSINRKLKYIKSAMLKNIRPQSNINLKNTITQISKKIKDNSPPTTRTLSNWIRIFKKNSYQIDCLIDNRKGNFTPRKKFFILDFLKQSFIKCETEATLRTAQDIDDNITNLLVKNNIDYKIEDKYTLRSIQRFIKAFSDPYTKDRSKNGYRSAQQLVRAAGESFICQGLMHIVQIDSHKLDIIVLNNQTLEVDSRPNVTIAIDTYTRVIVGFYISKSSANSYTSLQALKDMITRPLHNQMGGIPAMIVPDNGSENMNHSFLRLCENLGITIIPAQLETPDNKAYIENYFKNLAHGLIQKIPGTTFSSPKDREKYDSSKFASITFEQLELYIREWINIYHHTLHSGLQRVPISLWNQEISKTYIKGVTDYEADMLCRIPYSRTLNGGRILYNYLYYYSHALKTYEIKGIDQVIVLVDESDLSYVYVHLPDSTIIKANSTQPDYTNKLTLQEHEAAKLIKKKLKLDDMENFPSEVNVFARIKLRQLIEQDIKSNKKKKKSKSFLKTVEDWTPTLSELQPIATDIQKQIIKDIDFGDFETFGYEVLEPDDER
ncbi:transposase [Acinetobacter sp. ANC 4636]